MIITVYDNDMLNTKELTGCCQTYPSLRQCRCQSLVSRRRLSRLVHFGRNGRLRILCVCQSVCPPRIVHSAQLGLGLGLALGQARMDICVAGEAGRAARAATHSPDFGHPYDSCSPSVHYKSVQSIFLFYVLVSSLLACYCTTLALLTGNGLDGGAGDNIVRLYLQDL